MENDTPNKKIVRGFLEAVTQGKFNEAYENYVDMGGKHHNVYYASDFATLRKGMEENHAQFPDKEFDIKMVVEEKDRVITFSNVRFGGKNISVMHAFRIDLGKIVEMWDCAQIIPTDSPNKEGAFF